jgi:hypothetical protein
MKILKFQEIFGMKRIGEISRIFGLYKLKVSAAMDQLLLLTCEYDEYFWVLVGVENLSGLFNWPPSC